MGMKPICRTCGDPIIPVARAAIKSTCLPCGEQEARRVKHTIVPMAKSNYVVVTDINLLKGLNKYSRGV
jgi:hypothetical protein